MIKNATIKNAMIKNGGHTMFRTLIVVFALALFAAACGSSPASTDAAPAGDPVAPAAEATHDDAEAAHEEDEAAHEEDEAAHDEEATHDDDHGDDEAAHEEDEAAHDEEAVDADRVIEVSMTELSFAPDALTVAAGETIQFVVTNVGQIEHEFRLSNEHRIEEHMASGHADHDGDGEESAEEGGHHGDTDIVLLLEAGETGEVTVTFPEDSTLFTEIACLIPGHYEAGMKAPLDYA